MYEEKVLFRGTNTHFGDSWIALSKRHAQFVLLKKSQKISFGMSASKSMNQIEPNFLQEGDEHAPLARLKNN